MSLGEWPAAKTNKEHYMAKRKRVAREDFERQVAEGKLIVKKVAELTPAERRRYAQLLAPS